MEHDPATSIGEMAFVHLSKCAIYCGCDQNWTIDVARFGGATCNDGCLGFLFCLKPYAVIVASYAEYLRYSVITVVSVLVYCSVIDYRGGWCNPFF